MKYRHLLADAMSLDARQAAVLGVLMLRGPQTLAELRSRGSRLASFGSLEDVETTVNELIAREPSALVARLPRRPGQKEARYAHLLAGEVAYEAPTTDHAAVHVEADGDRIAALEDALGELRKEVADLRGQLEAFRKQFE
jgi:uncharacterized protein YceH (UPF0502 family)